MKYFFIALGMLFAFEFSVGFIEWRCAAQTQAENSTNRWWQIDSHAGLKCDRHLGILPWNSGYYRSAMSSLDLNSLGMLSWRLEGLWNPEVREVFAE